MFLRNISLGPLKSSKSRTILFDIGNISSMTVSGKRGVVRRYDFFKRVVSFHDFFGAVFSKAHPKNVEIPFGA